MRALLVPLLLVLLVASGCRDDGPQKAAPGEAATAMDTARADRADALLKRTYVFLCEGDFRFVARLEDSLAHVFLPGVRQLRYVRQADTLYRGPEGSLRLWTDSTAAPGTATAGTAATDTATATTPASARAVLAADGTTHAACANQPEDVPWASAKLSGVGFRALGHAPRDWNLDLYGLDSLAVFVTDGGRTRWRIPSPTYDLRRDEQQAFYRATADGQPFEVRLQGRGCTDEQTGRRLATTVAVTFRGTTYTGCGRDLN